MNNLKKVFITGASGCVGHYLVDEFLADPQYQLILLVRDRKKLLFNPDQPRITLVEAAIEDFGKYGRFLLEADYIVHAATSWGGSFEVNFYRPLFIFQAALARKCRKIIHFSTASILDENNRILPAAREFGSEYIKSKLKLFEEIKKLPESGKIISIFPTLVLGGDEKHPHSYLALGRPELKKWFRVLRFLKIDAGFHLAHAADIARCVKYLIENETAKNEFVLGNPYTSADQFIEELGRILRQKIFFRIQLPVNLLISLARLLGATFLPWDLYCARHHRHFRYQVSGPADFGLTSEFPDLKSLLN